MAANSTARCYNHIHVPRKYTPGKRRVSVYVTWTYPGEANRDVTELDNRFSTMNEVRRVGWPGFEDPQYADRALFQQGIAGTLELVRNAGPAEGPTGLTNDEAVEGFLQARARRIRHDKRLGCGPRL